MATTATFTATAQNSFPGSTVIEAVTHRIPDATRVLTSKHSVTAEFTGTGSNNITVGAAGAITVNSVQQKDPITGANVDWDNHSGFFITVGRASPAVAPTGTPTYVITLFAGVDTTAEVAAPMSENFFMGTLLATDVDAVNGQSIVINLTGTTGYKVSVIALGSSD